jgi:hypothetical protein
LRVRDVPDLLPFRAVTRIAEVTNLAMSAHLAFVDAGGGCGIVLVITPRGMMEMNDKIAIK